MNCAKVQKVVVFTSLQPHFPPHITLPATSVTRALEINAVPVKQMFIGQYIYQLAGDVAKSIKYSIAIPVVQYLLFLIYLFIYVFPHLQRRLCFW